MARQHGVTVETTRNLVIDAGAVYLGYVDGSNPGTLLGATRGGSSFSVEQEIRDMTFDGAKGLVKGGRRIARVTPKITANFVQISADLFKLAFPGSSIDESTLANHDEITRALTIALTDYASNIVIIGEVSGSQYPIICGIENALADGNVEFAFADNDESVLAITFSGHFDPSDLDTEPWFVRYPNDATTTTAGA